MFPRFSSHLSVLSPLILMIRSRTSFRHLPGQSLRENGALQRFYESLQFPSAVVLNAVGRRNRQMRAKERK